MGTYFDAAVEAAKEALLAAKSAPAAETPDAPAPGTKDMMDMADMGAPGPIMDAGMSCPMCAAMNDSQAKVCDQCGSDMGVDTEEESDSSGLNARQEDMKEAYEEVVSEYGPFDMGAGANGAYYMPGGKNPFVIDGVVCSSCVFYSDGYCEMVDDQVDDQGSCKLWISPTAPIVTSPPNPAAPSSPTTS